MHCTVIGMSTVFALAISATASGDTLIVEVGSGVFSPNTLNASPGDVIRWERVGGNHTVTSGSSCTADNVYFNASINSSNPVFEWTVPATVTGEIPYFCDPHCGSGMIATITVAPPAENSGMRVALVNVVSNAVNYTDIDAGSSSIESLQMEFNDASNHMMVGLEVESETATLFLEVVGGAGTVQVRTIGGVFDSTFPAGAYQLVLPVGTYAIIMTSTAEEVSLSWSDLMHEAGGDAYVSMDEFSGTGGIGVTYRESHDIGWFWLTTAPSASASFVLTAVEGDAEQTISWIGAVTGDGTFTMPAEASDSEPTTFSEGDHTLTLAGASTLGLQFEDGGDDSGGGCISDLNDDGAVDGADLTLLLGSWGICP